MYKQIMQIIDSIENPIVGVIAGIGTAGISLVSLLEYWTVVFGFIGAFIGCLTAIGSFYVLILKIRKAKSDRIKAAGEKRKSTN